MHALKTPVMLFLVANILLLPAMTATAAQRKVAIASWVVNIHPLFVMTTASVQMIPAILTQVVFLLPSAAMMMMPVPLTSVAL